MFQSFHVTTDSRESAARIAALRAALSEAGVGAFIVPRGDAHQGETVAPCDERLACLTGFTGSAGTAVVTRDAAALFVDGRYTLQAAEQTDPAAIEVIASRETSPLDWLKEVLPEGGRVGIDPWLHAMAETEQIEKRLKRA